MELSGRVAAIGSRVGDWKVGDEVMAIVSGGAYAERAVVPERQLMAVPAGIDVAGSHTLANVLAQTCYGGAVAACGLAQGMDLPATVAPFILRGVALLVVDSVMAPKARRLEAWQRLASDLDMNKLEALSQTIGFDGIVDTARAIVDGKVRGRVAVDMTA